jgi:hypothetical protein
MPFFNQIMNFIYKYTHNQSCKPLHNVTFMDVRIQHTTHQTQIILFTYIAHTCAYVYVYVYVCVCVCARARARACAWVRAHVCTVNPMNVY